LLAQIRADSETYIEPFRDLAGNLRRLIGNTDSKPSAKAPEDVRFLDGDFVGVAENVASRALIERLKECADQCSNEATRLAFLWVAVRHLAAAPYDRPEFTEWVPLWEDILRRWATSAAWYGLHGILALGRLAAVNSLREVRALLVAEGAPGTSSIHAGRGALASEYYSMAKLAPSEAQRRDLLRTALRQVKQELTRGGSDPTGLLLIKGPIELRLGKRIAAIRTFRRALRIRRANREDPGRIGEAETHLGFAYLSVFFCWSARRLLRSGVQKLEQHRPDGFLVTAIKKLGYCYCTRLDIDSARREFQKALRLALDRCYFDQAIQLDGVLQSLPSNTGRLAALAWLFRQTSRLAKGGF